MQKKEKKEGIKVIDLLKKDLTIITTYNIRRDVMRVNKQSSKTHKCDICGNWFRKENFISSKGNVMCEKCWKENKSNYKYKMKVSRYFN